MRLEMPQNIHFNSREIYSSGLINAGENIEDSSIFDKKLNNGNGLADNGSTNNGSFEILAKNAAKDNKLIDIKENNENSVIFQQDRIKDILYIVKNNSDNAEEEVKKYWEEYGNAVKKHVEEFKTKEEKNKVIKYFLGIKRSVIGSLATIKFFKEKGFTMNFSTTQNDRFGKCDFMFQKKDKKGMNYNLAVQLKSCMVDNIKDTEKDWEKNLKNAISINKFTLDKKDELEFEKLKGFCSNLHKKSGEFYSPVFIKMPVDMNRMISKKGESKTRDLVDERGFFQNKKMKNELDFIWNQRDEVLTKWNNGVLKDEI